MHIEKTAFGSITIDGKTFNHDVVVQLSEKVIKRKKSLSKKHFGTSHTLSKEEIEFVFEKGCESLIIGTGQYGRVQLSKDASNFLKEKGCVVKTSPTPQAIEIFNTESTKKIGLFHITC